MLRNLNATYAGKRILASPYVGVLAETIAAETAEGDQGPGILYNESIDPAYVGKYLRAWITNPPTVGSLIVAENGAIEGYDLPVGIHEFAYDLIVNDAYDSASSFTVSVGVVDATASGVTLTGTATLTAGTASGEISASASGVALAGTSGLTAGSAEAINPGTAQGVVLTCSSVLTVGAAVGNQNASAPGVEIIGYTTLNAGSASALNPGGETWPSVSDVRLGVTYGPTGTEYTGTMTGGTVDVDAIAAAVLAVLQGTTIPVDAVQGAWPTATENADAVWSKQLP